VLNGLAAATVAFCALVLLRSAGRAVADAGVRRCVTRDLFRVPGLAAIALVAGLAWSRAYGAGGWFRSWR
jgi:hypothetical protein